MTQLPAHLVLLAHGSRDPAWREPFEQFVHQLSAHPVRLAYMEMAEPTLLQVVTSLLEQSAPPARIDVLPLFMAQGGHLRHDVPNQIQALQQAYPSVTFNLLPPVGQHPAVVAAMRSVCETWANTNALRPE